MRVAGRTAGFGVPSVLRLLYQSRCLMAYRTSCSDKRTADPTADADRSPAEHAQAAARTGPAAVEPPTDAPPEGGYGWSRPLHYPSYGVFLSHYLAVDYIPGATGLDFAFIGGIQFGAAMLIAPASTILTREMGRHFVMSAGVVLMTGGYIAASFATRIWHLYISQGILVGLGIGAIFTPAIAVLPQWFLKRRSLAQGLAACGSGLGGLAFSLGTNAMIERLSVPWSLRIIGLLCLVGNGISVILVRDRNHVVRPTQLGFATHLLRRYDCLLLLLWAFVHIMGYMILLYSLSSYGVEILALSQTQAGYITAALNLGTAFGPCIGFASDRFGRIAVAASLTFFNGVIILAIWIPADAFGVLVPFALVSGATMGAWWMTVGPICAEVAGLKEVPSLLSLQWLAVVLPTTFAEALALYLRRPSMGRWAYLYLQVFAGLCYMTGSVFMFELWRVHGKVKRVTTPAPGMRQVSS